MAVDGTAVTDTIVCADYYQTLQMDVAYLKGAFPGVSGGKWRGESRHLRGSGLCNRITEQAVLYILFICIPNNKFGSDAVQPTSRDSWHRLASQATHYRRNEAIRGTTAPWFPKSVAGILSVGTADAPK